MLSAIKNVQVIVHLMLLSVVVPANAQIFYGAIAEMVAFDPIEIDMIIDLGFKTRPDDDFALDEEDIFDCQGNNGQSEDAESADDSKCDGQEESEDKDE